jgi:hypothetical protein
MLRSNRAINVNALNKGLSVTYRAALDRGDVIHGVRRKLLADTINLYRQQGIRVISFRAPGETEAVRGERAASLYREYLDKRDRPQE